VRPELSAACTLIVMHEPTCPHRDFYNPLMAVFFAGNHQEDFQS
jgi:hypothetical protein